MEDALDLFKECPKCGLIWMKTEGGRLATCGEKGPEKDVSLKKEYKYNFSLKEEGMSFTKE
jgi:hypothetical protein